MAVLAVVGQLLLFWLYLTPVVGMADSGDFERVLAPNGLAHVSKEFGQKYFAYFNLRYGIVPLPQEAPVYLTSTALAMRLARAISVYSGENLLDIRLLASMHAAALLLALALLLVASRPLGRPTRWVLAAGLVVVLTDPGLIAYFNSFYSEGTAAMALLLVIAFGLVAMQPEARWPRLALTASFAAMAVLVTAKPMYALLAPVLLVFGLYVAWQMAAPRRFLVAALLGLAVSGIGTWYLRQVPPNYNSLLPFVAVFMEILPNSPDPARDLEDLGLLPGDAAYINANPYTEGSPLYDPAFVERFSAVADNFTLARFYLRRPARLYGLLTRCAKRAFDTRVDYLGYYEVSSGRPGYSKPFAPWSVLRETLVPRSVPFVGLFLASGAVAFPLLRGRTRGRRVAAVYTLLVAVAAVQLAVAILLGGGEPDVGKHLFLFNVAFDLALVLLAVGACWAWRRSAGRWATVERQTLPSPA
jgi:hypothetical protein